VHDAGGRWLPAVADAGAPAGASAPRTNAVVALHVPIADHGGELVVAVPLTTIFDGIRTGSLGTCSVSASDGRVVLDEEGPRQDIVLDVFAGREAPRELHEAGLSTTQTGRSFAFALVPSVPLLVSITDPAAHVEPLPRLPLLVGGAVLGLAMLGGFAWRVRTARPWRRRSGG
jgi:hypothetical protein